MSTPVETAAIIPQDQVKKLADLVSRYLKLLESEDQKALQEFRKTQASPEATGFAADSAAQRYLNQRLDEMDNNHSVQR